MQQPLKYLTHLSTFWPIRMTVTRYLRQKTCCVPFFEYLMKSVSLTLTKTKNPDFTLLWKISTFWAAKIFHFLPEFEHVGYFAARDIWAQLRGACGHITACAGTCHYADCGREPQHCRLAPSSGWYAAITGDSAGKIMSSGGGFMVGYQLKHKNAPVGAIINGALITLRTLSWALSSEYHWLLSHEITTKRAAPKSGFQTSLKSLRLRDLPLVTFPGLTGSYWALLGLTGPYWKLYCICWLTD